MAPGSGQCEVDPDEAVRRGDCGSFREGVAGLLAKLPVVDLTFEDPPLEEVMRQVFAGAQPSAPAPPAPAGTDPPVPAGAS